MSAQHRLQLSAPPAQQPHSHGQSAPRAFDFSKPWIRTDVAVAYLDYRGKHALRSLYRFIARKGIRTARRSHRCLLVNRQDIDRAIGATRV